MKKVLIVVCALLLAVPAVSFAGSATSMWDLTIGGNVKFDTGWTTGGAAGALWSGIPEFRPTVPQNQDTKYGNQIWGAGESALNFFIKGPDTWGAKTHAFLMGDFTGVWGGSNYGTFDLVAANMVFDWPMTSLTIGQAGLTFMCYPTAFQQLEWNPQGWGGRAPAPVTPEILLTQKLSKEFNVQFGIFDPEDVGAGTNAFPNFTSGNVKPGLLPFGGPPMANYTQNFYTRSPIPGIQGAINYGSDACGRIGPWNLQFGLDGIYGQQKFTQGSAPVTPAGTVAGQTVGSNPDITPIPGPANAAGTLSDHSINIWAAMFKWMVPIIPEKNQNKTGALLFDGDFWATQGWGQGMVASAGDMFAGNIPAALAYVRPDLTIVAPLIEGVFLHGQYWLTDKVSFNAWYSYSTLNATSYQRSIAPLSENAATANISNVVQDLTVNLLYDVNPAIRLGVEFNDTRQHFANQAVGFGNEAVVDGYRFSAYYFF